MPQGEFVIIYGSYLRKGADAGDVDVVYVGSLEGAHHVLRKIEAQTGKWVDVMFLTPHNFQKAVMLRDYAIENILSENHIVLGDKTVPDKISRVAKAATGACITYNERMSCWLRCCARIKWTRHVNGFNDGKNSLYDILLDVSFAMGYAEHAKRMRRGGATLEQLVVEGVLNGIYELQQRAKTEDVMKEVEGIVMSLKDNTDSSFSGTVSCRGCAPACISTG